MDADGINTSAPICPNLLQSVFYSREFGVIVKAGRKMSRFLGGRRHRHTCSHFSRKRGHLVLGDATRAGRPRSQGVTCD